MHSRRRGHIKALGLHFFLFLPFLLTTVAISIAILTTSFFFLATLFLILAFLDLITFLLDIVTLVPKAALALPFANPHIVKSACIGNMDWGDVIHMELEVVVAGDLANQSAEWQRGVVMEFLHEIVRNSWAQYDYSRRLEESLDVLKIEMQELSSQQTDVIIALNTAKVVHGKKPKAEVSLWLENVEKVTSAVTKIEVVYGEIERDFSLPRVALGKRVVQKIEEVVKLKEKGRFSEGLLADLLPESGSMPTTKLVGRTTAERNLEQIWESLMDQEVRTIGVYGMGGVGKTTIMTHIFNKIQSSRIFGLAIWVTVSNDSNIERLQNGIAREIGLDISYEDDEMRRSKKLFEALKHREKFVIILDDMWKSFPLEKVGIPEGNTFKIVLTTRSKNVCQGMKCQKKFEVEVLSREEAWELFKERLGADVVLSSEVEQIAKLVTEECGGLPLGIITVASAMREKDDVREWRNALEELKCSTMEIEGMDDQVFPILKFSYDRLKSDRIRSCFLYYALFPEDYAFRDEELLKYWIAEGLIDDMGDWEKEQDKGHTVLIGLIDVCMLVRRSEGRVVMHDLIRDLAIGITRKRPLFVVKAGMRIRGSIGVEEFTEEVEKLSLMRNQIEMISGEPNCPKLSTLLLQENPLSGNISHEFFNCMNSLRILDLSMTYIEYLPESVSNLENLCMLLLNNCWMLREVPSLAKLKRLRFLDLYKTGIKEVPDGMECLVNLKEFYVSSAKETERINAGGCNSLMLTDSIIKLKMGRCDLSSLHCLSRLQHLQSCDILECSMKWLLPIGDNSTIIPSLPSIQSLDLMDLPNLRGLCEGVLLPPSFACLRNLVVWGCQVLENVMSLELFQHLQCLEYIDIEECSEMEEVIKGGEEGDNNNNNNTIILLPNLKRLELTKLAKLKSICKRVIICPSLKDIMIRGCHQLKKIPLSFGNSTSVMRGMRGIIRGRKEWWDALEWDDPNTKTLLTFGNEETIHGLKRKAEQVEEVASTSQHR
ncbi:probable disease resistance protein At5g63020 [Magnolia sinica]|uniref:probable disease resistance protein At5g63020 n=1 Tax=Magnolia sinica TaxID=86752 RepID=UPI002657B68E|nr:probable disease resistance protein At5g63020 [Magnolia sinica]